MDSIDSISKKIMSLGTDLNSFCPDNELVIDSYIDTETSSTGIEENTFVFGNVEIDYRMPKQGTRRSSISTRGLRVVIIYYISFSAFDKLNAVIYRKVTIILFYLQFV